MAESSVVVEKSLRSVFVGNIPYEATEEKLRDIFGQAGPVASFKLMYDRESGKPKGYGFCEYKDQETALSAMRNLNGYEIGGRPLRVDNACTEKSRMEMQSLMMGNVAESPYGAEVEPDKAPEAISNAVASLPPEQMYELMRQMKLCVRNNSAEARTMLMNNPQLAYALLQAQVVMRIIDPKMAVQILHGSRDPVKPIFPKVGDIDEEEDNVVPKPAGPSVNGGPLIPQGPPPTNVPPPFANQNDRPPAGPRSGPPSGGSGAYGVQPPHPAPVPPPSMPAYPGGALQYLTEWPWPPIYSMDQIGGDHDLRQMGGAPRGGPQAPPFPPSNDQDMRMPPHHGHDNFNRPPPSHESNRYGRDFDQRDNRFRDGPGGPGRDRDSRESFGRDNRDQPRNNRDPRDSRGPDRDSDRDFRSKPPVDNSRDPRARNFPPNQDEDFRGMPSANPTMPNAPAPNMNRPPPSSAGSGANLPPGMDRQDQEKANLIMQVLQLSDEQIRMLPPEQQTSILQLKEQIQRSSH